ncbi:MAG: energy transducer TonB [Proteobacteria bacterium]|nr:energy transducer TonB [Pseudomonadota bacterium]MDA1023058.1 energy transducer TonB [Pseudomonadota bacterium]
MRDAFIYSTLFHAVILVIGYFGLPYIQRAPLMSDAPILVDIVNVDEITNAPPPKAKPAEKPKPEAKKPPPPKKLAKASPPPPPPPAEKPELASLPPEPTPKAKPKPKPEPEKKAKSKPKPQKKLAKVKPRRKPKPPDAFASVLKTVEKLKARPPEKKKEKKEEKKETFEQQMANALSSRSVKNNPLRPLAISEIDLVRQQIRGCWNLPAGAKEAQDLSIEIRMVMNSDGTVRQARILNQNRLQSDPFFRAAAESALRAVLNPRCNPLKLPPEKYQQWQNMILIFDPSQMF